MKLCEGGKGDKGGRAVMEECSGRGNYYYCLCECKPAVQRPTTYVDALESIALTYRMKRMAG